MAAIFLLLLRKIALRPAIPACIGCNLMLDERPAANNARTSHHAPMHAPCYLLHPTTERPLQPYHYPNFWRTIGESAASTHWKKLVSSNLNAAATCAQMAGAPVTQPKSRGSIPTRRNEASIGPCCTPFSPVWNHAESGTTISPVGTCRSSVCLLSAALANAWPCAGRKAHAGVICSKVRPASW